MQRTTSEATPLVSHSRGGLRANSTMAAAMRKGEQQRKINIQVRGTAGVLMLGGTLIAAVAAAVWIPRGARRGRKENEDVHTEGDLKLIDVKENDCDLVTPSPSSIGPGEFIAEDADVIQGNVSMDDVEQDNKTCNGEGQISIQAKADIRVDDLALTAGDQSRNIQETKNNSEETKKESPPTPSKMEEQALPIQYDEDDDLGIEHETSVSEEDETEVSSVEEASKDVAKSETSLDSSVESNEAAVWPTEMMEEYDLPPLEPVEIEISYYESRKLMENSLELYRKEEEDKHQNRVQEAAEYLKATRLNFDAMRDYKGLLLMLVLALAIGMLSFVHHHQLAGDDVL